MPTFEVHLPPEAFELLEKATNQRGVSKDDLLAEAIYSQFGDQKRRFPSCSSRDELMEMLGAGLRGGATVEVDEEYWERLDRRIEGQ